MAELHVIKSGFDGCYDALKALSTRLHEEASSFSIEQSEDTSQTGGKEQECYEELLKMMAALADLADETARDVRLTQARYVLADK